ncbi:MAG: hydrolase 1, exosortase A system-associated [Rhodocyclaceae bacterium]
MSFREQAVVFPCQQESLVGVVCRPETAASVAVLIVVGGPQYRAGSHRQFVLLARYLANHGIASLRFDVRGMGDGTGEPRGFAATAEDIAAALAAFSDIEPAVSRFVLWGLCDGATAAAIYAPTDPRVCGLVLLNPWVRTASSQARTYLKHYYPRRLLDVDFWRKLLRGEVRLRDAVRRFVASFPGLVRLKMGVGLGTGSAPELADGIVDALRRAHGRSLVVLSGRDYVAREFEEAVAEVPAFSEQLAQGRIDVLHVKEADHTFSSSAAREAVAAATAQWVCRAGH